MQTLPSVAFDDRCVILRNYVDIFSHNPPRSYKNPNDGFALGEFIYHMRRLKKAGKLSEDLIKKLELAGIVWSVSKSQNGRYRRKGKFHTASFTRNCNLLSSYYATHNALPSSSYVHSDTQFRLGRWVSRILLKYNQNKLSADHLKLLCEHIPESVFYREPKQKQKSTQNNTQSLLDKKVVHWRTAPDHALSLLDALVTDPYYAHCIKELIFQPHDDLPVIEQEVLPYARSGDSEAYKRIYSSTTHFVVCKVLPLGYSLEDTLDLISEITLRFTDKIVHKSFDRKNIGPIIARIIKDLIQKEYRTDDIYIEGREVFEITEDDLLLMLRYLCSLHRFYISDHQSKDVFFLRMPFVGKVHTFQDIARHLGLSRTMIGNIFHHAQEKIEYDMNYIPSICMDFICRPGLGRICSALYYDFRSCFIPISDRKRRSDCFEKIVEYLTFVSNEACILPESSKTRDLAFSRYPFQDSLNLIAC